MQFPSQNSRFLCNRPDGPLKVSRRPVVSRSFSVEDVRTLEQHLPDARSSFSNFYTELDFSSRHCLGSFYKTSGRRGNTSGRCPTFQNILVFLLNATRSYREDRPDAWSSRPDVDLIKIELLCFWKDIAENRSDVAILLSGRSTARVHFSADFGFL
jgi:hypothetical protein